MSDAPLSCREAASQLWALLDDALPEADSSAVREHLRTCAECESHRRHASAFQRAVRDAGRRIDAPSHVIPLVRSALLRAAGGT